MVARAARQPHLFKAQQLRLRTKVAVGSAGGVTSDERLYEELFYLVKVKLDDLRCQYGSLGGLKFWSQYGERTASV